MTYSSDVLATTGLVSYWTLGESSGSAVDSKGAVTGTVSGATQGVSGIPSGGTAYRFDGTNDSVGFGDVYDFAGTAAYSIEAWIKPRVLAGSSRYAVAKAGGGGGYQAIYLDATNRVYSYRSGTAESYAFASSAGIIATVGAWTHYVATYDGTLRLYRNGTLLDVAQAGGTLTGNAIPFSIGQSGGGGQWFDGDIAHVAVYSSALSGATITAHYNSGITVPNVAPVVSAGIDATITEGDTFTRSGSFTDADGVSWTATVDYGEGGGAQSLSLAGTNFSLSHQYNTPGVYTVTVVVTDDDTDSGSDSVLLTVNEQPGPSPAEIRRQDAEERNRKMILLITGSGVA